MTTKNYTYSMKVVDFVVDRIRENPSGIIDGLKKEVLGKEQRGWTPGAKDSKP